MALAHQARNGQHLIQDSESGDWQIVTAFKKPTLWAQFRNSKFYSNTYLRLGLACVAGAGISMGINHIKTSPEVFLPITAHVSREPVPPISINLAPSAYALEPTDLSQLPPPIGMVQTDIASNGPLPEKFADDVESTKVIQPAAEQAKPSPKAPTVKAVSPAVRLALSPLVPVAKPPMPIPATTPKAAHVQEPSPKMSNNTSSKDDGKMAVFNEPLQVAKPPAAVTLPPLVSQGPTTSTATKNSTSSPSARPGVRMLAIESPSAIVVTNPLTRLPIVVKVGESLPDGSVLKSIDKTSAVNSRGEVLVLQ